MSFTSWLRNVQSYCRLGTTNRKSRPAARCGPAKRFRLQLECLEDRCVPAQYAVTDLGALGYRAYAYDLNEAGQVVGYSYAADGHQHAILWNDGAMIDLGIGNAYGINDLGQVVGSANGGAFLITPQGGMWFQDSDQDGRNDFMVDLGTLRPIDINNAGQVIGNSGDRALLWDAVNGMTDLGVPVGFTTSSATGINSSGQVAGLASDPASGARSVFLWDAVNDMTTLGAGPEDTPADFADFTIVGDINDSGQIAGFQQGYAGPEWVAGFSWLPDSPNSPTGDFILTTYRTLTDINNHGEAIGTQYGAYAYGPDGILDYQLLPGSNVSTLWEALAINDGGAIVAYGVAKLPNSGRQLRPFLLTPIPPGTPALSIANAPAVTEGNGGTRAATFTVTLSATSTRTISVAYATSNGTSAAGSDYQAASGTLTFAPGETSKTITVLVNGDRLGESNETFAVNLTSPTNATIADGQGQVTIVDDEPRISISDVTRSEGRRNKTTLFTFTVTLSAAYDQPVTMSYATANGTATTSDNDYIARTGTLTFAPGETSKTITIDVKGDSKKEANETFYLDLFGLSDNSLNTKSRGLGTILNDD
jgi:probable HAF family extracellular repeat protein